jgi:regulator of replication initiation timing
MRIVYFLLAVILLANHSIQAQGVKPVAVKKAPPAIAIVSIPDSVTRNTDQLSRYLQAHTSSPVDYTRALYNWMATAITYDMVNTYKPDYYKDSADAVIKTLQTRMGICQGYAALFNEVCRKGGIPAYFIGGYTQTDGRLDNASHAWVAVQLYQKWYMMDPTWGAGYMSAGKFVRKLNWNYFMVPPEVFVKTHMPFDPLWQLLAHPYRHDEFRDNNWSNADKRPVFYLRDSLTAFERQSLVEQMEHKIARIESYGITNQLIGAELQHARNVLAVTLHNEQVAKQHQQVDSQNEIINKYNKSGNIYNDGVQMFNAYIAYKNAQFKPNKTDQEIKQMIDIAGTTLGEAERMLKGLKINDASIQRSIDQMQQSVADLQKRVVEEQAFVQKYMKTSKVFRKTLFYKFGG